MSRNLLAAAGVTAVVVALSACAASKSSTPLSPSVAGPIPGVTISAPKMLEPVSGIKIAVDKQPVTLLIENASTSGVRPLTYLTGPLARYALNSEVLLLRGAGFSGPKGAAPLAG